MKIGFLVPGFSKCGTTSLCAQLGKHPEIFISRPKEPGYYASQYERGADWYESLFSKSGKAWLLGEGSTQYSTNEYAELSCQRILADHPDVRLIFIARDPIRRLESSFREMHTSGYAYGLEPDWSIGKTLASHPNMLLDSHYWRLINRYRQHVADERILVLFLEEFQQDSAGQLRRCFEFLGVDPAVAIKGADRRYNSAQVKRYDTPLLRRLRRVRVLEKWLTKVNRRFGTVLRLSKPFKGPVVWDEASLSHVKRELTDDAHQFLDFYGRPRDFWKCSACVSEDVVRAA